MSETRKDDESEEGRSEAPRRLSGQDAMFVYAETFSQLAAHDASDLLPKIDTPPCWSRAAATRSRRRAWPGRWSV